MKAIQEERMRGYFLTAAKGLIRGEGLDVVSTRNVAERAGYSYATLYNYFKDIRDLIFSCVEDFMAECREFVVAGLPVATSREDALVSVSTGYSKFFVQYPGIFDLFYQTKANQISTASSNFGAIDSFFDSLSEEQWRKIAEQSKCADDRMRQVRSYHKLAVHGLLMSYLNRRTDIGFKALIDQVRGITQFAIETLH